MTLKDMKAEAKRLGMKGYSKLGKEELIGAIENHMEAIAETHEIKELIAEETIKIELAAKKVKKLKKSKIADKVEAIQEEINEECKDKEVVIEITEEEAEAERQANGIEELPQETEDALECFLKLLTYSSLNRFISLNRVKGCTGLSVEEKIKKCLNDLHETVVYTNKETIKIRAKRGIFGRGRKKVEETSSKKIEKKILKNEAKIKKLMEENEELIKKLKEEQNKAPKEEIKEAIMKDTEDKVSDQLSELALKKIDLSKDGKALSKEDQVKMIDLKVALTHFEKERLLKDNKDVKHIEAEVKDLLAKRIELTK